jgi:hypothetical protein
MIVLHEYANIEIFFQQKCKKQMGKVYRIQSLCLKRMTTFQHIAKISSVAQFYGAKTFIISVTANDFLVVGRKGVLARYGP